MIESLHKSSTIPLLEKMAVFGERRQEVLASNIANFDTPQYKTRDLPVEDFQRTLKEAVSRDRVPSTTRQFQSSSSTRQTDNELFPETLFQAVETSPQNITFQDANNRSIEHEVMEITKNSMMQNYAIELMRAQMTMLQIAISERF
jgi:flagellar basal-body rod protein FlgB